MHEPLNPPHHAIVDPNLLEMAVKLLRAEDVRVLICKEVELAGSQSAFARRLGIHASDVNNVVNKRRGPAISMLKGLGLRRIIAYERIKADDGH